MEQFSAYTLVIAASIILMLSFVFGAVAKKTKAQNFVLNAGQDWKFPSRDRQILLNLNALMKPVIPVQITTSGIILIKASLKIPMIPMRNIRDKVDRL